MRGMSKGESRETISSARQRNYWNHLADAYAQMTRIRIDDFHFGPQIPGENTLHLLPTFQPGQRALELGCGGAQNSIWLAKQGVACVALDISQGQLAHARQLAAKAGVSIELRRSSLERFEAVLEPGELFDFVHSSHALEFVQEPGTIVAAMRRHTRPGGTVMVSTVHPLFNGLWMADGEIEDGDGGDLGESGSGLFLTDYFAPPDDVRDDEAGHAVSRAWPVSAWFRWFRDAGLEVTALAEPAATPDAPYTSDDWADHGGQLDRIPSTLILVGRVPA